MKFTDEQLRAINHKEGNLKIIACAGSGKTTVMSERIAKLVSDGIDRDKIVAFTFTEKAATSLKFNIREALTKKCPETPHLGSMFIGTIHEFAFQKLKELVPKYRNYDVLDELKRVIWIAKNYRKLGLKEIKEDTRFFDAIQRFIRSTDIIRDNNIEYEKLDEIPAFKSVYDEYITLIDAERYLDFSGMIYRLVNLLKMNPSLLSEIRSNIQYLVVDEYQDINHIQEELISLIAGKDGNLCVVGDDDQSIFEFQGAEVDNIIHFEKRYNNVTSVSLEENFRCPKEIIEAARDLIRRNQNRIEKTMTSGKVDEKSKICDKGDIYKLEFDTIDDEVSFVIDKINELRGVEYKENDDKRGLDYGDMAIIVRNRISAQRFIEPFRREGIRFTFRGTGGLFQRPEIDFLRNIFSYIAGIGADNYESTTKIEDIKVIFDDLDLSHLNWMDVSKQLAELKELINSICAENKDGSKRRIFLQEFYYTLMNILGVNQNNFAEEVLYDFGRLSNLIAQFESVHGWINKYYFGSFAIFVNGYAQNKTDEGGIDDPRNTNSVNVLTVHQAKGLEFPIVFIPDLSVRRFPSQNRTKRPKTHLTENIIDLNKYCSGDEGERRLFYVASTRTKKFLFISRSKLSETNRSVNRSNYFTEFDHEIMIRREEKDPTKRIHSKPKCKPNMELLPTSFSDLKYYLNCPYSYLLQQMMGFSPVLNTAYGYGLQVHNLLNHLHKKWVENPPKIEDVEALTESDFILRFTRGKPFENMKGAAKRLLTTYVNEYGKEFPLRLETEKPFELILGGALISGSIDLIQKINPQTNEVKEVSILDFKTEKEKLETKEFIRTQLRLYAIAGDKSLGLNPQSAKIHYLTENFRQEVDISKEKLNENKEKITKVIDGIKKGDFPSCSGDQCKICDVRFVCNARKT